MLSKAPNEANLRKRIRKMVDWVPRIQPIKIKWALIAALLLVFMTLSGSENISDPGVIYKGIVKEDSIEISGLDKSGERIFGRLLIHYEADSSGTSVLCRIELNTVLVGLQELTLQNSSYPFDVQVALDKANGEIKLLLPENDSNLATLYGDFIYPGTSINYRFKGTLAGWYISP